MKKRLWILLLLGTLLLSGCRKTPEPAQPSQPEVVDYVDFKKEAPEMTVDAAETILADEAADKSSAEYREAVYTVNDNAAQTIIAEAREAKEETEKVISLFGDIAFRFLEGEEFESATVRKALTKLGTWEKREDGWYIFTFYDRTLPQVATDLKKDHALTEYQNLIELLLQEPNIEVKPIR